MMHNYLPFMTTKTAVTGFVLNCNFLAGSKYKCCRLYTNCDNLSWSIKKKYFAEELLQAPFANSRWYDFMDENMIISCIWAYRNSLKTANCHYLKIIICHTYHYNNANQHYCINMAL